MKTKTTQFIGLAILLLNAPFAVAQGTTFTYQGRLMDGVATANGNYDLRFVLSDASTGGTGLATNQFTAVAVSNGLFTVALDFGAEGFDGSSRWLQVGMRPNGGASSFAVLSPAQLITPTPYSIHAANGTPPGGIIPYMGTNPPSGWLLCDGAAVSRGNYPRLFAAIGLANGSGDGVTTFNLPDLRGMFLRGLDGTAGIDPDKAARIAPKPGGNAGNSLGSFQADQFKSHNHANGNFNRILQLNTGGSTTITATDVTSYEPDLINCAPMLSAGGSESRPRNISVNYIIKF